MMAAFPLWQLTRNYAPNDHHRRTYEMRYLDALFATLEPSAAIVYEAYAYDQLILYKLIGERAAGDRSIRMTGLGSQPPSPSWRARAMSSMPSTTAAATRRTRRCFRASRPAGPRRACPTR